MDSSYQARQNSKENLLRLSAQRRTYRKAKRLFEVRILLCLPVTTILSAVHLATRTHDEVNSAASGPSPSLMIEGVAAAAILIASYFLVGAEKRLRLMAARIQESFDCDVLSLPWNSSVAGHLPSYEDIYERAGNMISDATEFDALRNWYPKSIDASMGPRERAICQRTNTVWDSRQRSSFLNVVRVFSIGALIAPVVWGTLTDVSLRSYLFCGALPMLPLIMFFFRYQNQTTEALRTAHAIQKQVESCIYDLTQHNGTDVTTDSRARVIQDEIFRYRAHAPFVPDWYYHMRKNKLEGIVAAGADNAGSYSVDL